MSLFYFRIRTSLMAKCGLPSFAVEVVKSIPFLLVLTLCLTSVAFSATRADAKTHPKKIEESKAVSELPDPEILLQQIFKSLSENKLKVALVQADALVQSYPNYQLGHLIRGDLLLMHTTPIKQFGVGLKDHADKLKELRDEAMVRIRAFRERPSPDMLPRNLLQLRKDQRVALLVDAKKSRLYVYEHVAGQFRFAGDFYVSQGKLGVNKQLEGDQKTPVGVYYIMSRIAGAKLPPFYGPGALPLNYPNEWDKLQGRSGSGIWLHGMPQESFSRPPLASDGCVVLTNPDFQKLAANVDIGKTPVIIADHIEFIPINKWVSERQIADKLLEDWRRDIESKNINRIVANYSRSFKSNQGENLNQWLAKQNFFSDEKNGMVIKLTDVTQFRYPGKEEMIVSTFSIESSQGKNINQTRKRLYWVKEQSRWRIVYEAIV